MEQDADKRNGQELQIVQAFSSVEVSERLIRSADIKGLVGGMLAAQDEVGRSAEELERVHREKKDGSRVGNWLNKRDDKLQDAQVDLQQSLGSLSRKSSQLLIANAAISKVLSDQQQILLQQQNMLKQQADMLEEQNRRILGQQQALEQQQQEIDETSRGLLETRGVAVGQTEQLVSSVRRLEEAESQMEELNQQLITCVSADLVTASSDWNFRLEEQARDFKQRQAKLEHQLADDFRDHIDQVQVELEAAANRAVSLVADIERKLQRHLQAGQDKVDGHDSAIRQLHEALAEQLTKLRQDMIASQERNLQPLRQALDSLERRLSSAREEQIQIQSEQGEALERLESELKAWDEEWNQSEPEEQAPDAESGYGRLALAAAGLALVSLAWQVLGQLGVL